MWNISRHSLVDFDFSSSELKSIAARRFNSVQLISHASLENSDSTKTLAAYASRASRISWKLLQQMQDEAQVSFRAVLT